MEEDPTTTTTTRHVGRYHFSRRPLLSDSTADKWFSNTAVASSSPHPNISVSPSTMEQDPTTSTTTTVSLSTMEEVPTTSTTTRHVGRYHLSRRPLLSDSAAENSSSPLGHITFRLLCTYSTSGAVIGKSGSIVKLLQQETGVKIRAEAYQNRSEERIMNVIGPQSPRKTITLNKENGQEENEEVSPAQHGLIRVLERVWEVEAEKEDKCSLSVKKNPVSCRLLADENQIGYVKGRGGNKIKQLESDYKAKIWVISNAPSCAPPNHKVIQIAGVSLAVKRATLAVSQCLQDVPPLDKTQITGCKTSTLPTDTPFSDSYTKSPQKSSLPHRVGSSADCTSRGYSVPGKKVVFRLLCSSDRIGGVIGKSGKVVKALEDETGASIRTATPVAESDDRVIHISAMEYPESQYSPAQNAVICVFKRSIEVGNGEKFVSGKSKDPVVEARLLISLDQTSCLIGVGGTIISEIKNITGTSMWISRGDEVPPCAAGNDALVKIEGSAQNVQNALFIVTGKLRNTIFCNNMVNAAGRIKEPIAAGSYPSLDRSHKPGQRATLTEGMHHLGLSHTTDHSTSPEPWRLKTMHGENSMGIIDTEGMHHPGLSHTTDHSTSPEPWRSKTMHGENSMGVIDTGRGAADSGGGLEYASERKSAVVMNATLEILVPEHILEKESNLSRLRQISGAKVSVHDHFPGSNETTLVISGTPDQTQTAQSVLQGLILGSENS